MHDALFESIVTSVPLPDGIARPEKERLLRTTANCDQKTRSALVSNYENNKNKKKSNEKHKYIGVAENHVINKKATKLECYQRTFLHQQKKK